MSNNLINNKNIVWVDIVKFIGIFLVVLGHSLQTFELTDTSVVFEHLWKYIYLFHMPLFFIIAGYLYKSKSKSDNYKKIICGLLIPYFIYQFLYLPFRIGKLILLQNYNFLDILPKCLLGIISGDFVESPMLLYVCGPCWFIMTMIQLRLLFNNIKLNTKNLILITLLSILILKCLFILNIDLYFCLDNTLMAIPYFGLGHILKTLNFSEFQIGGGMNSLIISISIILACCILLEVILNYNGLIQMNLCINEKIQNKSLLLAYFGGILGTLMTFIIANFFNKENDFIKVIGKNTLFIIFFHWLLLFFTRWFKLQLLINYFTNIFSKCIFILLFSLLILTISYFIIKFLEKHFPVILGKYQPKGDSYKCI